MKIPTFELTDKNALVTGATKGLGYGIAIGLAQAGANIVVVSRTPADCEKVAEEIRGMGRKALALPTDITDEDSVNQMVETAVKEMGSIDILVNNAGSAITKRAEDLTMADWDRVVGIDLRAAFMAARAVGKVMIGQKKGKIINIASIFGLVADKQILPYLAAKGGVVQMTKGLAMEWAKHNINVNAVAPGYVITPMNEKDLMDERVYKNVTGKIPMRRLGRIEDIAGAVVFLASEAADYATGAVFNIDGGWLCQ